MSSSSGSQRDSSMSCSADTSCQYWREFSDSLQVFSQFDGATKPQDIILILNDIISEGEKFKKQIKLHDIHMKQKDEQIAKHQKQMEEMLQGQATLSPPSTGGEVGQAAGLRRSDSSCRSPATSSNKEKEGFEDLQKKYSQLVESKDMLYGHWKTVKSERDTFENELQTAQNDCERLKNRVRILENLAAAGATNCAVGDNEVVLKRDENGRCGVRFASPKMPPLLMESNTIIADVKDDVPNRHELNIGDFVIDINGCNVQFMKLRDVLELVNTPGDLKLKLRSSRHNKTRTDKQVQGHKTQAEWGLTFGVYVKATKPGSFADANGMHEMDELIKVNSYDVYELSLKKIYNAMTKDVKFCFQKLLNPYEQIYDQSTTSKPPGPSRSSAAYSSGTFDDGRASPGSPRGRNAVRRLPLEHTSHTRSGSSARSYTSNTSDGSDIAPQNLSPTAEAYDGPFPSDGSVELSGDSGGPSADELRNPESVTCVVTKQSYEAFGWSLIGGNKVGIYVTSVENWSPVEKADIAVGWKILQINETSFENVAFSFALDFMATLRNVTSITVKLKKIQPDVYRNAISLKPSDSFHVRSVMDYKKKSSDETSFKKGEIFNIIDSHYIGDSNTLRWRAKNSASQTVIIPCQKASVILSSGEEGIYERKETLRYYTILDPVDIKADRRNDATEGFF